MQEEMQIRPGMTQDTFHHRIYRLAHNTSIEMPLSLPEEGPARPGISESVGLSIVGILGLSDLALLFTDQFHT